MKAYAYVTLIAVVAVVVAGAFIASDQNSPYSDAADPSGTDGNIDWVLHEGVLTLGLNPSAGGTNMNNYASGSAPQWYAHRYDITEVVIGTGITTVGDYAFSDYYVWISSVTIGDDVKTIGECAFYGCPALSSVTIGNSVETIGIEAFGFCYSLASITIPDSVETIDDWAFHYCYSLSSVTIGNGVETIGAQAFMYCVALSSIIIPGSVTYIGLGAFQECNGLYNITFEGSVPTLGASSFSIEYSTNRTAYVWVQSPDMSKFTTTVRDNTTITRGGDLSVSNYPVGPAYGGGTFGSVSWTYDEYSGTLTFSGTGTLPSAVELNGLGPWRQVRAYVHNVIIEDQITAIGVQTFYSCYSLSSVTIGDGVEAIGNDAFYNCYSLTSVIMPDSVKTIGGNAFLNCYTLSSVTIGAGVKTIGGSAFSGCSSLPTVTIPRGVETINGSAFYNCYTLTSVDIMAPDLGRLSPDASAVIGQDLFLNDRSLTAISIYNPDIGDDTGTRYYVDYGYISSRAVVVYYDIDQPVRAVQSQSGDVTLSGFTGSAQVGTTPWDGDIGTISSGESFERPVGRVAYVSAQTGYDVVVVSGADGKVQYAVSGAGGVSGTVVGTQAVTVPIGETITLTGVAVTAGFAFEQWTRSLPTPAVLPGNPIVVSLAGTYAASFAASPDPVYTISSHADSSSTITPSGSVAVLGGGSATFSFAAAPGYDIDDIVVDGASVPSAVLAGTYTFSNVRSNHTISVSSKLVGESVTLTVDISGGDGVPEYHIGPGSPYGRFVRSQPVALHSDVYVSVDVGDGYKFVGWTGDVTSSDIELHIPDASKDVSLVAHLEPTGGNGGGLSTAALVVVAILAILVVAFAILWLVFGLRRSFEVVKVSSSVPIVGKDRARYRRAYRFSVEGGSNIRYRIGEDGAWKAPARTAGGYEIPKEDVTATVTIEAD
ncbi:MAG: leucine-rich repeat domain-containing protein [Candidatus Methanoplasma sp.]|jgi:hypothetical protein|nr:leucine-rich repeat domain-containing protein [Candidatus Methanoplasma sp.]